jgi:hypothetical protein
MASHGMIKVLNLVFVFFLCGISVWMLYRGLVHERVRKPVSQKRRMPVLRIARDGKDFLKLPLTGKHYLIGRDPSCDIILKGSGIALQAGVLRCRDGRYFFKPFVGQIRSEDRVSPRNSSDGGEIRIMNYSLKIEYDV